MNDSAERCSRLDRLRGEEMRTPDEVAAMRRLRALVGGAVDSEGVGCSRRTVRRYLAGDGWVGYRVTRRAKKLDLT